MAKLSITVCDVCQSPSKPTKRYTVKTEGGTTNVDLCVEHGAPIDKLLGASARPATRRSAGARATTVEEIEEQKAAGRK